MDSGRNTTQDPENQEVISLWQFEAVATKGTEAKKSTHGFSSTQIVAFEFLSVSRGTVLGRACRERPGRSSARHIHRKPCVEATYMLR